MKKDLSFIVAVAPNMLACLRCGEKETYHLPARVEIVTAIWKIFEKLHKHCKVDATRGEACGKCLRFHPSSAECAKYRTPEEWRRGHDTGLSSQTIYARLTGGEGPSGSFAGSTYVPLDPSDFGRCYRFLKAFPEYRARIGEMATVPGWRGLAENWDELERLFEEEEPTDRCPKLYARIQELTKR